MSIATLSPSPAISGSAGLTTTDAARRYAEYGANDPALTNGRSAVVGVLALFFNPLALLLLVAAILAAFLGQATDASIIVVMVFVGVALNFVQTYRSQSAIKALQKRVRTTASVLRDGCWQEIARQQVVPDDVIRLFAGDMVPADALLLESTDLYVQQAALTGESLPVEKACSDEQNLADDPSAANRVFLGTSVVSGSAIAKVTATGQRTVFGGIAARLADRRPATEFELGLRQFGLLITRVVLFLVVFLISISIALHHDPFQSVLFAVALAVGLTPEFLPMITSVTLAKGAVAMARCKVIVKHLAAIQNFGSIDVLCSDKTGTLTSGVTELYESVDLFGCPSDHVFELGFLNSKFETGLRNPLNLAMLERPHPEFDDYQKCSEVPFDFERRCVSAIVERNDVRQLITKGAPESVIQRCARYQSAEGTKPLSDEIRAAAEKTFHELSSHGFRILSVAYGVVDRRPRYSPADETNLVLSGYLVFSDPPRLDAADTVLALKRDGIRLKVLTGDSEVVTRHVCEQVGLEVSDIILGEEIAKATDAALAHLAEKYTVFARVSTAQKNRIIRALKQRSHVVGYLGDGINDAPSLHAADVGISVDGAADVARDAADIILVEPGLNVLHAGILEGRKASANVLKYLLMGTSSNFGNMLSMAGASLLLPFLPMLPTQILLNNFLYDVAQITIPTDQVDSAYLQKPQRWNISLIQNFMILIGPISSIYDFLTFFILLHYFHASQAEFHTGWFVESLATQTLVLFVIRTFGNPLESRPSKPLVVTVLGAVGVGLLIPVSPLGPELGFTSLPIQFYAFLILMTVTYLMLVEVAKRHLFHRVSAASAGRART